MTNAHQVLEEHLQSGRLDPAEAMARHMLEANTDDALAHVAWARISAARGNVDDGIKRLERLLAGNPKQPDALAWLAVLWNDKGDPERALLLARRAASLGARVPSNDVMLGDDALSRNVLDEALRYYDRAVQQHAKLASGWIGRGRVLRATGQLADAEDAFARAVEVAPLRVDAWVALIEVELEGGADEAAADNLSLALKAHPGNRELLALKASEERKKADADDPVERAIKGIRALIFEGNTEGALRGLYGVIDQFPGDARTFVVEAEIAAVSGQGDIPALINTLNRMVRDRPTSWEPRAALGRIMLRPGPMQNVRMGLAHCEEAWRTSGEHPRAGLFLFEAYAVIDKRALALALGQLLAKGEGPEAMLVRQLIGEVHPPLPSKPFSTPPRPEYLDDDELPKE
ncbi:MAG TPA: tetratricopeptide repeat protein [Myxococcota bacterium]